MLEVGSAESPAAKRPRRRPGENRERLLAAGVREFGTFGYHGTSTAAIADAAVVPQPHVYANFETKQDLFLACAERVFGELVRAKQVTSVQLPMQLEQQVLHHRFLLQAVAAAPRVELHEQLAPLLLELRERLGERCFDAALANAATSLLE